MMASLDGRKGRDKDARNQYLINQTLFVAVMLGPMLD